MKNGTTEHDAWVANIISKIPDFEKGYMEAILEEHKEFKDNRTILSALKQIALAQGINKVAERSGLPRVTISRALSAKGNPRMDTFMSIIDAMGLNLSVSAQNY